MNRARVIELLRELLAELETDDAPRAVPTKRRARGLSYPEPLKPHGTENALEINRPALLARRDIPP